MNPTRENNNKVKLQHLKLLSTAEESTHANALAEAVGSD